MKLKLMTYNIAAGRVYRDFNETPKAPVDLSCAIGVIKEEAPDVCGINEVDRLTERSGGIDQPKLIGESLGYNCVFGKSIPLAPEEYAEYGNAFATRFPILEYDVIKIPECERKHENRNYEPRTILRVKVDIEGREVYFLHTHFGLTYEEQEMAVKTILHLIDEIGDKPVVFSGDLNAHTDNPVLDPLREKLFDTGVLKTGDYITYPTHNRDKRVVKIDYIFLSHHFKPLATQVPQVNVSDHYPYYVETEF